MLAPDPRFAVVDEMSGLEFEESLVELFALLGFEDVERTGGFDKGADILCSRNGHRYAVQAKRKASAVGIDAVRQLIDGMKRYGCSRGLVVTNSYFTEQAIECAEAWNVGLWDRRVLAQWLDGEAPGVDTTACAECGRRVTEGVRKWCLENPHRYGGNVYCVPHQKRRNRRARRHLDRGSAT